MIGEWKEVEKMEMEYIVNFERRIFIMGKGKCG